MTTFLIIFLSFVLLGWLSAIQERKTRIKGCYSFECKNNLNGVCKLKEIVIYNNSVIGLCLNHTSSMQKRVLDPLLRGIEIGKKDGEADAYGKISKALESVEDDAKLLKDKNEFAKWMKEKFSEGDL